jgi:hypothetical protein
MRRDVDIDVMSGFPEELVLPFLWAQDGFDEPSEEMAHKIGLGLRVPGMALVGAAALCSKSSLQGGGALVLCLGLAMLASGLLWGLWARCYIGLWDSCIGFLLSFTTFCCRRAVQQAGTETYPLS